jgi:beta-lactamase class A
MVQKQYVAIALACLMGILPAAEVVAVDIPAPAEESPYQVLDAIAANSGLSSPTIAVCDLERKCLNYQGSRPPQNAASLIKVPIAIALVRKLAQDNISLDTEIYVDPSNYTEENFSSIRVRRSYSFKYLLTQAIAYSSNIATNQIIDYLGWDYINKTLVELGYPQTRVSHKLKGYRTNPSKNVGWEPNRITSNELTAMMVAIYNRKHPEYEILAEVLGYQVEKVLGFRALKASPGRWLGEKTGETSQVRGTTVAVEIHGKVYIITMTGTGRKRERKIRRSLYRIVNYIVSHEGI